MIYFNLNKSVILFKRHTAEKEAGMNAHLSKPIEPDKLYETIAHLTT